MEEYLCDTCGTVDLFTAGCIMKINSMQKDKRGKATAYKTTYILKEGKCNPCIKYIEKPLEEGNVECDYFLNEIK